MKKMYDDATCEIETYLIENGMIDDLLYWKDINKRVLYIDSDITVTSALDVIKHILRYNQEDDANNLQPCDRKPIRIFLSTYGGEIDAGFGLIDVIVNSATPVYTINLSCCYSMGFLIGLAGHKRYGMPNSKFLLHDGSSFVYNSSEKVQDYMDFSKSVDKKIKDYVLNRTKISSKAYNANKRKEWYMLAEEAKEKLVIHYIIGEDIPLSEIL